MVWGDAESRGSCTPCLAADLREIRPAADPHRSWRCRYDRSVPACSPAARGAGQSRRYQSTRDSPRREAWKFHARRAHENLFRDSRLPREKRSGKIARTALGGHRPPLQLQIRVRTLTRFGVEMSGVRPGPGNSYLENGALVDPRTLDVDRTAVQVDEIPDNRQA